jgi:hypothetical protein
VTWPDKVGIGVACPIVAVALNGLVVLLNGLPPTAPFAFQDWTRFGTALSKPCCLWHYQYGSQHASFRFHSWWSRQMQGKTKFELNTG